MAKFNPARARAERKRKRTEALKRRRAARAPCTVETPRCDEGKNLALGTPECCQAHIRRIVFSIADLCDAHGLAYWLDYGTLLGAVRNPILAPQYGGPLPGGLIPHDKDADLGMLQEDFDKLLEVEPEVPWSDSTRPPPNRVRWLGGNQWVHKLIRKHAKNPVEEGRFRFSAGNSIKVRVSRINHLNCDIFPWHLREKDGLYHRARYVGVDRNKGRQFPPDRLFPLTEIEWEGRMLKAPHDPAWFCEHRYGRDWQTPIHRNNDGRPR